jgi:PAS domain-containing protein
VVQPIRNGALSASAAAGVDEQGLIQWWNSGAETVLGWGRAEVAGLPLDTRVDAPASHLARAVPGGTRSAGETRSGATVELPMAVVTLPGPIHSLLLQVGPVLGR